MKRWSPCTADAVFYPPDVSEVRGTAAIRAYYTDWFAAMTITDAKVEATYATSGDLSFGHGSGNRHDEEPKAGGAPQTVTVRITAMAKKVGGTWKYLVDHGIRSAPPGRPRRSSSAPALLSRRHRKTTELSDTGPRPHLGPSCVYGQVLGVGI